MPPQLPLVAEALASCRFCLRPGGGAALCPLPIDQLADSDIPKLFEVVAGVRLDLAAGYSELMCADCERHMRFAGELRTDFLRVVHQWQTILSDRVRAGDLKAESPLDSDFVAVGFDSNFVDCSLMADDEVKLETDGGVELNIDFDNGRVIVKDQHDDDYDSDDDKDFLDSPDYQSLDNGQWSSADDEDDDDDDDRKDECRIEDRRKRGRPCGSTFGRPPAGEKLTCDICDARLSSKYILIEHIRNLHHPDVRHGLRVPATCPICGKAGVKNLHQHLTAHRRAGRYQCAYCPKRFGRAYLKTVHERRHTGERPFECGVCGQTMSSRGALLQHRRMQHGLGADTRGDAEAQMLYDPAQKPRRGRPPIFGRPPAGVVLTCDICDMRLASREVLLQHMRKHYPITRTCPICGKTGLRQLAHHMRDHRRTDQYVCSYCPKTFKRGYLQLQHERRHTGERPFVCDKCGKAFTTRSSLHLHVKLHHAELADGTELAASPSASRRGRPQVYGRPPVGVPLTCDICDTQVGCRQSLISHMEHVHHPNSDTARRACPICGKTGLKYLDHHIQNHRRRNMFHCAHCPKTFGRAHLREQHERRHTGERPYVCDKCGAAFTTVSILRQHMKHVHNEGVSNGAATAANGGNGVDGVAAVPVERRKRGRPEAFMKLKPGERYTCDICDSKLSTKPSLFDHMRNQHGPIADRDDPNALPSTCHICGKSGLKNMTHHMRDHRRANQYRCQFCPRTFCRDTMRQNHERQHTGERPYVCDTCAYTFTTPTGLRQHQLQRHSATTPGQRRPHRPQKIRTAGAQRPPVLRHPHTYLGRLGCPLCPQTCKTRASLHMHLKHLHAGDGAGEAEWRRYVATVCAVCGERFADALALMQHRVSVHYECEICRMRFESRELWERHMQVHEKHAHRERKYRCGVCQRMVQQWELRAHLMGHTARGEEAVETTTTAVATMAPMAPAVKVERMGLANETCWTINGLQVHAAVNVNVGCFGDTQ